MESKLKNAAKRGLTAIARGEKVRAAGFIDGDFDVPDGGAGVRLRYPAGSEGPTGFVWAKLEAEREMFWVFVGFGENPDEFPISSVGPRQGCWFDVHWLTPRSGYREGFLIRRPPSLDEMASGDFDGESPAVAIGRLPVLLLDIEESIVVSAKDFFDSLVTI